MPKLYERIGDVSIIRSYMAWVLVHGIAQTWVEISRSPTGALGAVAPHIGAVVALEMEARRARTDVLPGFISLNTTGSLPGSGYFPSTYAPFQVAPSATGLAGLSHPDGAARLALRWKDLETIDARLRQADAMGKPAADVAGFYRQAKTLIDSSEVNALFAYTTDEYARYGSSAFGASCLTAKKLLAGRRGTRFVQVSLGGWDMHSNVYGKSGTSLYSQCAQLDAGLASLILDLKATAGETPGKTLFDETVVFVAGEFGRTVGALNGQAGRDHFFRSAVMMFGGGIRPGQVIGSTDATGANLKDAGWSANREVRPEDVACTVYSALGIDWTTVRRDDPFGRGFEYVPPGEDGPHQPVDELLS